SEYIDCQATCRQIGGHQAEIGRGLLPDAAKHRQYLVIASSLLALVLVCFLASADVHASPLRGIEKQVDLEHGEDSDQVVTHWAARREGGRARPWREPPLGARMGPGPVVFWQTVEAGRAREFRSILPVAGKRTILAHRLEKLAAPRAP